MTITWRPLACAAALDLLVGVGIAHAQTVIVRNAPPGSKIEFVLNTETIGSATVNAKGDATVAAKRSGGGRAADMDAYLYLDVCDDMRRVLVVERGQAAAPQNPGCTRSQISGLYLVRPVSTVVVSLAGPIPTVLLRQGEFSLAPPRTWNPSATGIIVFGGGALAKFRDVKDVACGAVSNCSADGWRLGYTAGAGYWFTRVAGAEVGYVKPAKTTVTGSGDGFHFDSALDVDLLTIVGKVGVPIGPVRIYGEAGADYHRASFETHETIDTVTVTVDDETVTTKGGTQMLELKTSGWGLLFGGGIEAWVARSLAIYGEAGFAGIKGNVRGGGEGAMDDRLTYLFFGARVRIH